MVATTYYVKPAASGGSDSNNGTTYALAKATLTGAEALSLVAGDDVLVAPGVYPETFTLSKSGGNVYTTGTVSLTNGSTTVTGSGTTFTGNTFVDGVFQVRTFVSASDGVTNGTTTFTSATGNFQASMVGYTLSIITKGVFRISAYTSATSVDLENADASSPAATLTAGSSLVYSIAQPESPYDIATVTDNTHLELAKPWAGPTVTGVPYRCWRPIRFIADVTGYRTDGIGGAVVLTASNDQATQTRTSCLVMNSRTQRTMRGFAFQLGNDTINGTTCSDIIVEDFFAQGSSNNSGVINITGVGTGHTFRRGIIQCARGVGIVYFNASAQDDAKHIFENLLILGGTGGGASVSRYGNSLIRNCTSIGIGNLAASSASTTVGQAIVATNNVMLGNVFSGSATNTTWLFEDYNAMFGASGASQNTVAGAHSLTTTAPLIDPPLLTNAINREPWNPYDFQSITSFTSPLRNKASAPYPGTDLYGAPRPQGTLPNWGAIEAPPRPIRETTIVRNGTSAMQLPGRGYWAMRIPVTFGQAITITGYSRHDTDASIGVRPRMRLLADYGVAEQSSASVTNGLTWNTHTIGPVTPVAPATGNTDGAEMILLLENLCTNSTSIACYWDDLDVS